MLQGLVDGVDLALRPLGDLLRTQQILHVHVVRQIVAIVARQQEHRLDVDTLAAQRLHNLRLARVHLRGPAPGRFSAAWLEADQVAHPCGLSVVASADVVRNVACSASSASMKAVIMLR